MLRQVRIPTNALRERAAQLLESPDALSQDAFGICGMAAVVYVLLKTNPTGAVDLLSQLFGGGRDLSTATDGDPRAQNQLMRYYTKAKPREAKYQLDFLLCRYIGVLMERDAPELFARQEKFTRDLAAALKGGGDDPLDMTAGNLAIHFDGMKWMVDRYLWAGKSKELKVSSSWPSAEPLATMAAIVTATRDHYVISAQDLQELTEPLFTHWVVLLDAAAVPQGGINPSVKWRPSEFSRGSVVKYDGITLSEQELRRFYPRMIMADT